MISFRGLFLVVVVGIAVLPIVAISQNNATGAKVVQVTFEGGPPAAYQRVGEWSWYGWFPRIKNWKEPAGSLSIEAVKVLPRSENGSVFVRVTLLRGRDMAVEDLVGDYKLIEGEKVTASELANFGILPFTFSFARAPITVADLPKIVNKTRSLEVSAEPTSSTLPTFKARVLNNSEKLVAAFAFHTTKEDGRKALTAMPQSKNGEPLIAPGETFERNIRYPLKLSTVAAGEVPSVRSNLVLHITAVIFFDGSYEGEAFDAASYLVVNHGRKLQINRFLSLLRSKDFTGLLPEINAAIIPDPDTEGFSDFIEKFVGLSQKEKKDLLEIMVVGRDKAVKSFKAEFAGTAIPITQEFIQGLISKYEERLEALPQ